MADLFEQSDVELPAQQIWDVIGDFSAISKWAPAIQGQTTEETSDGLVRSLPMGPDRIVRELRVVDSQYSYTYSMLDRPNGEYRSTIAVIPLDASTSRIVLILHVTDPSVDEDELVARYTKFLQGNMKAMRRAVGV
jgi:hypothetical protein